MTDEPDPGSGDGPGDPPTPGDRDHAPGRRGRRDLVAGEAAAIARFGSGPALFSPDVPAPRHPPVGPLSPRHRATSAHRGAATDPPGEGAGTTSSGDLVLVRRPLPAPVEPDPPSVWGWVWHGVEVVVDRTARGVATVAAYAGGWARDLARAVAGLVGGPRPSVDADGRR